MRRIAAGVVVMASALASGQEGALRPPATPLVTHTPYVSVWSFNNRLTDQWPRHWTGRTMAICGLARIDGKAYRWCGPEPRDATPMTQTALTVGPTATTYTFEAGGVALEVRFWWPGWPDSVEAAAYPLTHMTASVTSTDGAPHEVSLYADFSAEWCVNTPEQEVRWSRLRANRRDVLCFASQDQPILKKRGDDLRIDWGTFIIAGPGHAAGAQNAFAGHHTARRGFASSGRLPVADDTRQPRPASDNWPVMAFAWDAMGKDGTHKPVTLLIGYDERYTVELFGRRLEPAWRNTWSDLGAAIAAADDPGAAGRGPEADERLMADLRRIGGEKYARLAALTFRQTLAAHTIARDWDGTPLMFSKENFSNGCIGTVDVIFPASPFFLCFNPELLKAQLRPVLDYAASPRWKFPFAPHDLGTYPLANGQVYGGGEQTEENQMPVEETGNMLILLAAIARVEGNADFAARWWPTVEKWAAYLKEHALDPANQLCTDDFAGHLAHNANLAMKGIIGLGGYAQLCERTGRTDAAAEYRALAERYAAEWMRLADDGDHYRLAYDRPGTWSQKYNLIWDRVLGTGLFPPEVADKEMRFYRTKLNRYGLPLDNRETYAKLDFAVWTACLTGQRDDFEALVNPLYDFAHETRDRVPLTDWYSTVDGRCIGFRARSVVGAVYMPLLLERLGVGVR